MNGCILVSKTSSVGGSPEFGQNAGDRCIIFFPSGTDGSLSEGGKKNCITFSKGIKNSGVLEGIDPITGGCTISDINILDKAYFESLLTEYSDGYFPSFPNSSLFINDGVVYYSFGFSDIDGHYDSYRTYITVYASTTVCFGFGEVLYDYDGGNASGISPVTVPDGLTFSEEISYIEDKFANVVTPEKPFYIGPNMGTFKMIEKFANFELYNSDKDAFALLMSTTALSVMSQWELRVNLYESVGEQGFIVYTLGHFVHTNNNVGEEADYGNLVDDDGVEALSYDIISGESFQYNFNEQEYMYSHEIPSDFIGSEDVTYIFLNYDSHQVSENDENLGGGNGTGAGAVTYSTVCNRVYGWIGDAHIEGNLNNSDATGLVITSTGEIVCSQGCTGNTSFYYGGGTVTVLFKHTNGTPNHYRFLNASGGTYTDKYGNVIAPNTLQCTDFK